MNEITRSNHLVDNIDPQKNLILFTHENKTFSVDVLPVPDSDGSLMLPDGTSPIELLILDNQNIVHGSILGDLIIEGQHQCFKIDNVRNAFAKNRIKRAPELQPGHIKNIVYRTIVELLVQGRVDIIELSQTLTGGGQILNQRLLENSLLESSKELTGDIDDAGNKVFINRYWLHK